SLRKVHPESSKPKATVYIRTGRAVRASRVQTLFFCSTKEVSEATKSMAETCSADRSMAYSRLSMLWLGWGSNMPTKKCRKISIHAAVHRFRRMDFTWRRSATKIPTSTARIRIEGSFSNNEGINSDGNPGAAYHR